MVTGLTLMVMVMMVEVMVGGLTLKVKVKIESGLTLMEAQTYFLRRKCSDCEGKRRIVEQKRGGISLNKLTEQNDDDCYFEQKEKFSD